jgi:hypothetical protein
VAFIMSTRPKESVMRGEQHLGPSFLMLWSIDFMFYAYCIISTTSLLGSDYKRSLNFNQFAN